ncbi:hypothetical protein [Kitasatospora sp. CB02891]|nr:hypothetical protein [Kitasatospora sp. CB02891]
MAGNLPVQWSGRELIGRTARFSLADEVRDSLRRREVRDGVLGMR